MGGLERAPQTPQPSEAPRETRGAPRSTLLFVYGTLMRGYGLHRLLEGAATFLGAARVRGALLDLRGYPGLVEGDGWVHGELYRLHDAELLRTLDREEGYNFERRRADVNRSDGRRSRVWLYRYRGQRHRAVPIPDGDYRHARPAR